MSDIKLLTEKLQSFAKERDWKKFHNHKDLAISLVLEATEVLEHFQWKNGEEVLEYAKNNKESIGEELADVAVYLLYLSDKLEIDIIEAIEKKIVKNGQKYPVDKSRGKQIKYTKFS
jgi:dCTP diphosphatase